MSLNLKDIHSRFAYCARCGYHDVEFVVRRAGEPWSDGVVLPARNFSTGDGEQHEARYLPSAMGTYSVSATVNGFDVSTTAQFNITAFETPTPRKSQVEWVADANFTRRVYDTYDSMPGRTHVQVSGDGSTVAAIANDEPFLLHGTFVRASKLHIFARAPNGTFVKEYGSFLYSNGTDNPPEDYLGNQWSTSCSYSGDVCVLGAPWSNNYEGVGFVLERSVDRVWSYTVVHPPAHMQGEEGRFSKPRLSADGNQMIWAQDRFSTSRFLDHWVRSNGTTSVSS
jgi:hypothetical protein